MECGNCYLARGVKSTSASVLSSGVGESLCAASKHLANRTRSLGVDLDRGTRALRDVAWSTGVQHGPELGYTVFRNAIAATDRQLRRNDPGYEEALVRNIYAGRAAIAARIRDRARRGTSQWRVYDNVATIRYPRERDAALRMLAEERARARQAPTTGED